MCFVEQVIAWKKIFPRQSGCFRGNNSFSSQTRETLDQLTGGGVYIQFVEWVIWGSDDLYYAATISIICSRGYFFMRQWFRCNSGYFFFDHWTYMHTVSFKSMDSHSFPLEVCIFLYVAYDKSDLCTQYRDSLLNVKVYHWNNQCSKGHIIFNDII